MKLKLSCISTHICMNIDKIITVDECTTGAMSVRKTSAVGRGREGGREGGIERERERAKKNYENYSAVTYRALWLQSRWQVMIEAAMSVSFLTTFSIA